MAPRAEKNWSDNARTWWSATHQDYALTPSEMVLAREIARQTTRLDMLNAALNSAPLTTTNRFGEEVAAPLLVEARQISGSLGKLISTLRLPEIEVDDQGTTKAGKQAQKRAGTRGTYTPAALMAVP